VCVLDYVVPSPLGSKWGLGGTCVNVGCIPKKLMHKAGVHGEDIEAAERFGWTTEKKEHNWNKMVSQIQDYIASLNYGYKSDLRSEKVEYINAYGSFTDDHTVALNFGPGNEAKNKSITADKVLIAVGGRPAVLSCSGGELAMTSDDIFSQKKSPGPKICIVGASYVALEIAGFLTAVGFDVTILVRSILLRGFDQQMAELIKEYMKSHNSKFVDGVRITVS